MNIYGYNPDISDLEKTYLSSATVAGSGTVLKVKNSNNFPDTHKILIGAPYRARTEMAAQSSHTNTTLTVGITAFNHDIDDPVYALDFSQIRCYRSTTGIGGTKALLAAGTLDIDWNAPDGRTTFKDPTALPSYFYWTTFYDPITGAETDYSAPVQATGYPDNSVGTTLLQVVGEINDEDFIVYTIDQWIGILNTISKDLYKQAKRPYRFLKRNTPLNVTAGSSSTPFPADIWKIDYIEVNQYNAGLTPLTFRPKVLNLTTMRFRLSRMIAASDYVYEIAIDDTANTLLFNPSARTDRIGAFNFHYYKKFTKFTDLSNLFETPDDLVYQYGMKRAYYLRKADDDSKYMAQFQQWDKMYQTEMRMLQREKNIDASGPAGMGADRKRPMQFGLVRYRR